MITELFYYSLQYLISHTAYRAEKVTWEDLDLMFNSIKNLRIQPALGSMVYIVDKQKDHFFFHPKMTKQSGTENQQS